MVARTEQVEPVDVTPSRWGVIAHHESWQTLDGFWLPVELSDADVKESLTLFAEMSAPAYNSR